MSKSHSLEDDLSERVLGINWDLARDQSCINVNILEKPLTKKAFYPYHSYTVNLRPSVLCGSCDDRIRTPQSRIKTAWDEKLKQQDWDEQISDEQADQWNRWLSSLQQLEQINRCVKIPDFEGSLWYEMHHFADASTSAYGAVSYSRIMDENSIIHCFFL